MYTVIKQHLSTTTDFIPLKAHGTNELDMKEAQWFAMLEESEGNVI